MIVSGLGYLEFQEQAVHMLLDGAFADEQAVRDAEVRVSLRHEGEHFTLAWREDVERVIAVVRCDELLDKAGVDDRTTFGDPLDNLDEVGHVGYSALQEVAHPLSPSEQVECFLDLDVRRENEDRDLGKLVADRSRCLETLRQVSGRHPDVYDGKIGSQPANQPQKLRGVACLTDDLEPGPLEKARQPFAEKHVVVGQHHSDRGRSHSPKYGLRAWSKHVLATGADCPSRGHTRIGGSRAPSLEE